MKLSRELRPHHLDLSPVDWKFREYAEGREECLRHSTYRSFEPYEKFMFGPVQGWPTFVGGERLGELQRKSRELAELLRRVPELAFGGDPEAMARFYGWLDVRRLERLLAPDDPTAPFLSRGDFILGEDGFRAIEFNFSPSLGGWQARLARRLHLDVPSTREFFEREGIEYRLTDTMEVLYGHVVDEARKIGDDYVHLYYLTPHTGVMVHSAEARAWLHEAWERVLERRGLDGKLSVGTREELDESAEGGRLSYDGKPVSVLIYSDPHGHGHDLQERAAAGELRLLNGPLEEILTDKRNFALLSDKAARGELTDDDRRRVESIIPWSRLVAAGETLGFEGEPVDLREHLLEHREEVLLKLSQSFGGKGVVAGWVTEPEAWAREVDQALAEGDWMVQRRVPSLGLYYQSGRYGATPHDAIWGPFLFGRDYGGVFLRVQSREARGLVSVSQSASSAFVVELDGPGSDGPGDGDAAT